MEPLTPNQFIPAKTIKEAENFAINNGLAKAVDYSKMDIYTANIINKRMFELNKTGRPFDKILPITKTKKAKNVVFEVETRANVKTGALETANFHYSPFRTGTKERLDYTLSLLKDQKLILNTNATEMITHEFGHYLDNLNHVNAWRTANSSLKKFLSAI